MHRFTKYALITLFVIVSVLVVMAYIGYQFGGNAATDNKVNNAASGSSTTTYYSPFTIEHWGVTGEYIGFFAAGCVGGFLVGYIFPTIFNTKTESMRKN
jgi:hypothetical protein